MLTRAGKILVGLWAIILLAGALRAEVVATFTPETEYQSPGTGAAISIYRVDVKASTAATRIYPIDVFNAWPDLIPMPKEKAALELAAKSKRSPLRVAGDILTASASVSAVAFAVQSFVQSTNPGLDAKLASQKALISAGVAFVANYGPKLGGWILQVAPVYVVPEDTLSTLPFDLAAGEVKTFHLAARGSLAVKVATGQVRP